MNENIKKFLEKLGADEKLQAKFAEVKDPDEAYALASGIQDGFTKEEFITEMTKLKKAMDENLTDEDLAKSAGGTDTADEVLLTVTTSLVSVSVATLPVAASAAV